VRSGWATSGRSSRARRPILITVELEGAHATPLGDDPVSALVYSGRSTDVRDVLVDGRVLMREREVLTMDEAAVLADARRQGDRLARMIA